ncbi:dihydropteroate synthase [Telmatobacter bradus]|uniref:dihydropteroate synthase n=1 Tax=Telmatobacter bradus TaxID=474953 RepID=UPI003B42A6E7
MKTTARAKKIWKLKGRTLALGEQTLVCAIVNITPDSFSDGGAFFCPEAAVARAIHALDEGADLLDLGAESTRPSSHAGGAEPLVSSDTEQARLLPVVEGILKERPDAVLSIDTYKASTARAALAAGAAVVNDVSGLFWDPSLGSVAAQAGAGMILTHTRGLPDAWATLPSLAPEAMLLEVHTGLQASLKKAMDAGIAPEAIVLDPGYGFGKRNEENFALLARQDELLQLGFPLLAGLSRKSCLGHALAPLFGGSTPTPAEREHASIAALVAAILHGSALVRVHAVRPAVEAACIADAILNATH